MGRNIRLQFREGSEALGGANPHSRSRCVAHKLIKLTERGPVGRRRRVSLEIQFNLRDSNLDRKANGIQREYKRRARRRVFDVFFLSENVEMLPVSGGGNCVGDVSKVGPWKEIFHHLASH